MKKLFAEGLFIHNDDNGNPCCIGDTIKLTRPYIEYKEFDDEGGFGAIRKIPEKSWSGELVLLISKGVMLRVGKGYISPKFTSKGYNTWKWELIQKAVKR